MSKIHLIQSREEFGPELRREELRKAWKINEGLFHEYTHFDGKPSFSELFAMCKPDMVNVIANSDIYFSAATCQQLEAFPTEGKHCWALSRWDVKPDGSSELWDHGDSQDVWVVYGEQDPLDAHTYLGRDGKHKPFTMGIAGCDNRLVHILQKAGYKVSNPSKTIRTFHLHNVDWRSYLHDPTGIARGGDKIERIPPPYGHAHPTHL